MTDTSTMDETQRQVANETWWVGLLKGLALTFLGIFALIWPINALAVLIVGLGIYFLVDGIVDIFKGIKTIKTERLWYLTLLAGIIEVVAGIYMLRNPLTSTLAFVLIVGAVFIVGGILEVIAAFDTKKAGGQKVLFIIAGILAIIAGLGIILYPVSGGLAFIWVIGAYALVSGPIMIIMSIQLKSELDKLDDEKKGKKKVAKK